MTDDTVKQEPRAQPFNLHQRMLAITRDCKKAKEDGKVRANNLTYDFTSHNAVTELIQPLLVLHGVDPSPALKELVRDTFEVQAYKAGDPPAIKNRLTVYFEIRYINVDDPSDVEIQPWFAESVGNDDKQVGIAISAGIRQAYQKRFKLRSGDPDLEEGDGDDDDKKTDKKEKQDKPRKEPYKAREEQKSGHVRLVSIKQVTFFNKLVEKHGWADMALQHEVYAKFGVDIATEFAMSDFSKVVTILEAGPQDDIPF